LASLLAAAATMPSAGDDHQMRVERHHFSSRLAYSVRNFDPAALGFRSLTMLPAIRPLQ
jgi:hypothetical protein